jgi:hypothetical protein
LLIIILVIALLAVYYFIATDYLKHRRENQTLAPRLEEITRLLAQIPPSSADLEQRLDAARNDFQVTRDSFPDRANTTPVVNYTLRIAEDTGVKAIPLITQPWSTESVSDHDYAVFRCDISITGTFTRLVEYINRLETGELKTLIIESLSVERATEKTGEEAGIPVEASAAIAVYTQPPDFDEIEEGEKEEAD